MVNPQFLFGSPFVSFDALKNRHIKLSELAAGSSAAVFAKPVRFASRNRDTDIYDFAGCVRNRVDGHQTFVFPVGGLTSFLSRRSHGGSRLITACEGAVASSFYVGWPHKEVGSANRTAQDNRHGILRGKFQMVTTRGSDRR